MVTVLIDQVYFLIIIVHVSSSGHRKHEDVSCARDCKIIFAHLQKEIVHFMLKMPFKISL